jgi:hypothetical protein
MAGPAPSADEFAPLPWCPWDVRPDSVLLDEDECATALFLEGGRIDAAAGRLKVSDRRLKGMIKRCARLCRLLVRLGAEPDPK